jgi:rod shape-determining protein MreD
MNPYLPLVVLLGATLIQITLLPHLTLFGVHPELVFLLAVAWSLLRGVEEGILWGFVGGVALDIYSTAPFGVFTLALLFVCFVSGLGESAIFRHNLLLPMLATALTTLLYHSAVLVLMQAMGRPVHWSSDFLRVILPSALLNTLVMPFVYQLARQLNRWVGPREIRW